MTTVAKTHARDADLQDVRTWLNDLTIHIKDRSVGSEGNRDATAYFKAQLEHAGWVTHEQWFDALDWSGGTASLKAACGTSFEVFPSPYARSVDATARLEAASTVDELERIEAKGAFVLLHGALAAQPLMPKNFPFFTIDKQQRIINLLERSGAAAIITAAPSQSGRPPTPLIEDGDFDVPSVYMTVKESDRLLSFTGHRLDLVSDAVRIAGKAANVLGRKNEGASQRIVITAHIDAKKDVPGALDNATGVATLLLLAKLLASYTGGLGIDLLALNGEDHYAVPGQIAYSRDMDGVFDQVALNINIDGVGYREGHTAYSFFNLPEEMGRAASMLLANAPASCRGLEWFQGDHSMFVQAGCPAIAVTSNWLLENMSTQTITHTEHDTLDLVDPAKVVACALALKRFIDAIS
ncbi:M28 family peptidase [Thalassococcus sp. S3]|uniref:M28 family peptidase n=1 Tax=Thalassococcus sp. S3 TaxID=2017482 RepID=UPI001024195C|nr:M28 family peptidase [Thalassococcus sp. S3]QBF33388.1 Zn-dependent exopeptidase M28 [Thalassococcus sp. S3]